MPGSEDNNKVVMNFNRKNILWSLILPLAVLIVSIFFGNIFGFFTNAIADENFKKVMENPFTLWYYPVLVYLLFLFFAFWVKRNLDKKFTEGKLTRTEITKTIDKWSGVVDGIGTALPLVGAAVILFTVGLGQQSQSLFLEFAIPFEIKSLFILAIAKLFESTFDDLEIQYLNNIDAEAETNSNLTIEIINLPDLRTLEEINKVFDNWNNTMDKMHNSEFNSILKNIVKIIGRDK